MLPSSSKSFRFIQMLPGKSKNRQSDWIQPSFQSVNSPIKTQTSVSVAIIKNYPRQSGMEPIKVTSPLRLNLNLATNTSPPYEMKSDRLDANTGSVSEFGRKHWASG